MNRLDLSKGKAMGTFMKEQIDFFSLLDGYSINPPTDYWLRDRKGDDYFTWTFAEAFEEIKSIGAWLEDAYGNSATSMAILSKNRAHWILADLAIMGTGNVTIPLFTTMKPDMIDYIRNFTDTRVLFLGESMNWDEVKYVFPDDVQIIAMPDVDPGREHRKWKDILEENRVRAPGHEIDPHAMSTIVFTSGTTGKPKGVMNSQASLLIPCYRGLDILRAERIFSYLPLSHIAERFFVETASLVVGAKVTFSESLETFARDMADCRPNFMFGPPRIWQQIQQGVLAQFGGRQEKLDAALAERGEALKKEIRQGLGLDEATYLLSAAAPIAPSLIEWYHGLGLKVVEGFGQTELTMIIHNTTNDFKIGSIGKALPGVKCKITEKGELAVKAEGQALGYYKQPEATARTFRDGWVYTGDKMRVDEDGFYYIIGRVNDTFKTIQGKFVAPEPMESAFAEAEECQQVCLLGRGLNKTVMVCVLAELAKGLSKEQVEASLVDQAEKVNESVEKHARICAIIISEEPWTIENSILTHTMKIKRGRVEEEFGALAEDLTIRSAKEKKLLVEWA